MLKYQLDLLKHQTLLGGHGSFDFQSRTFSWKLSVQTKQLF
jgi:hypothetical protein